MNKIKENTKKIFTNYNMKIIIPVIVLLVLLIVLFIYFKVYQYNNYRDKKDFSFYQYFYDLKVEYDATVSFNKKKEIKGFSPKMYKINYGSFPIYYSDEEINNVIFPDEMMVILPLKKEFLYKIPEFSYVEKANTIQYLTFEDYHKNIDHYILYDGDDLYFFSDSVNVVIDEKQVVLSPLSYVIKTPDEFSYYDYETDTYMTYSTYDNIVLTNDYYSLNVTEDYITILGENLLLNTKLDYLNTLN